MGRVQIRLGGGARAVFTHGVRDSAACQAGHWAAWGSDAPGRNEQQLASYISKPDQSAVIREVESLSLQRLRCLPFSSRLSFSSRPLLVVCPSPVVCTALVVCPSPVALLWSSALLWSKPISGRVLCPLEVESPALPRSRAAYPSQKSSCLPSPGRSVHSPQRSWCLTFF